LYDTFNNLILVVIQEDSGNKEDTPLLTVGHHGVCDTSQLVFYDAGIRNMY